MNEYIANFLKENAPDTLTEWFSSTNQQKFKQLLPTASPLKPKQVLSTKIKSAYILFCLEERSKINLEKPLLSASEIMCELGRRWQLLKSTHPDQYRHYQKMASESKEAEERRVSEQQDMEEPHGVEQGVEQHVEGDKKDCERGSSSSRSKIQRKKSAYLFFCEEMRPLLKNKYPKLGSRDIVRELGKQWKLLPRTSEKYQIYQDLSKQDKREKKVYFPKNKQFILFCKELRHETKKIHPGFNSVMITQHLQNMWAEKYNLSPPTPTHS